MKNSECEVRIRNKHTGRVIQSWRKRDKKWIETSSKGVEREATAEQFISHLLPLLREDDPRRKDWEVVVVPGPPRPRSDSRD